MTQPLAGRIALVTGASRGIGRATALALSQHGWRVAVTGRRIEELDKTVAMGAASLAVPADIADPT
ncbi:MAG: SDR family oxidoreductase, partial [Bacteroidales bacterium]|nr:SDR family oxidoreductase [Bacteroidales bacterium]